jgi:hypothetical protein
MPPSAAIGTPCRRSPWRCSTTTSLRASATRALLSPTRCARRRAQTLSGTPQRRVAPQNAGSRQIEVEQPSRFAVAHLADAPALAHLTRAVLLRRQAKVGQNRPDVTRAREPSRIVDTDLDGQKASDTIAPTPGALISSRHTGSTRTRTICRSYARSATRRMRSASLSAVSPRHRLIRFPWDPSVESLKYRICRLGRIALRY